MLLLGRILSLALLISLFCSPQCWSRSKSMLDHEMDENALRVSRIKVDDLEGLKGSGSPSQPKGKISSRYNRLIQRVNAAPKASRESNTASFIHTVSTNDLKQLTGVQSIVYDKERFHLQGQGGTFIQSLLSHKDYAQADGATKLLVHSQLKGLLAKIWLWFKAWGSPSPKNAP